jgi:probable phosphomutase (TIGR03848 family)
MPVFLLIRHGETDYNRKMHIAGRLPNVHLTKKGQEQARVLADSLIHAPIKAIYSSPLERTLETAQPLARVLNLEIIPSPGLLESDSGEWQGQSIKKLRQQKIWQTVQHQPSLFHYPGGESIVECQHRVVQVLESLRSRFSPQELVACFSHADPIKQAIAFYLGLPLDNFQRLAIDTASVSALHITEIGSRLLILNYHPSLAWETMLPQLNNKPKSSPKS